MTEQMNLLSALDLPDPVLLAARAVLDANGCNGVTISRWLRTSWYARAFWPTLTLRGQYEGGRSQMQSFRRELRDWLREKGDPPEDTHWIELAMRDAVLAHPPAYWTRYRACRGLA